MGLYRALVRPALFGLDAETAHTLAIRGGAALGWAGPLLTALGGRDNPRLACRVAGLDFSNPVGLAAGYDKNGLSLPFLAGLGFGHLEIGSVSADPSEGNPRPRLFRLPEDRSIVVHYGLPNDGAPAIAARLSGLRHMDRGLPVPLGINIVTTNRGPGSACVPDAIIEDYLTSIALLKDSGDYLALNLSCPNTLDGPDFFSVGRHLDTLLAGIAALDVTVPLFLKISALGGVPWIERVLEAADPHPFVSGFIFNLPTGKTLAANLKTPEAIWSAMPGALSGPPVEELINTMIAEIYSRMDRARYAVIGVGGVMDGAGAYRKIRLGASLVQVLTALVFEGPGVVRRINRELATLLERDGIAHVADAVGVDVGV
ncbi:MAG: quinone-dependent dihydroorotate dehydrogenase [Rhodobacterales bacterium]|nr:quinone-dependent dihydroorotate dehydrogenase [Rhodobacterales bacterium]